MHLLTPEQRCRFTSKQLVRASKKAEKDEKAEKLKVPSTLHRNCAGIYIYMCSILLVRSCAEAESRGQQS